MIYGILGWSRAVGSMGSEFLNVILCLTFGQIEVFHKVFHHLVVVVYASHHSDVVKDFLFHFYFPFVVFKIDRFHSSVRCSGISYMGFIACISSELCEFPLSSKKILRFYFYWRASVPRLDWPKPDQPELHWDEVHI